MLWCTDIDLAVLTSFNRLKEMTEDIAVIADAVADSAVVQLSADKKKIRRAKPLPLTDDTVNRTVYMVCPLPGYELAFLNTGFGFTEGVPCGFSVG